VRLCWPGWKIAGLSLLVGLGLYPCSAAAASLLMSVLGYQQFQLPQDAIPSTVSQGMLAFLAYAVMAPVCEEFLFRGVIQRAYESREPRFAVLFVGTLFIIFHLSLLQGLSIVLLAFALGYVYWRSQSLVASMLTHFGANFLAAIVLTSGVFLRGADRVIVSGYAVLLGLLLAGGALWLLRRMTRPAASPASNPAAAGERLSLANTWPLLAAALIYLPIIGGEVIVSRSPELAAAPLQLSRTPWEKAARWSYDIHNIAGDAVGEAECNWTPSSAEVRLDCTTQSEAYDIQYQGGRWIGGGGRFEFTYRWQPEDMHPLGGESQRVQENYHDHLSWSYAGEQFQVSVQLRDDEPLAFTLPDPGGVPVTPFDGWPWQFASLGFEEGPAGRVLVFTPYIWNQETQSNSPHIEPVLVRISGTEEVTVPAGAFTTWKVELGERQVSWYAVEEPHTLVQFFDGIETWKLK
jgi:membrane protease YdiL (CAAX protease family)